MFSPGIEHALRVAMAAHEGQLRRGDDPVPYVTHSCHVALILARLGLDEVVIQAALLHDVVEDCEGWTSERIGAEFGPSVQAIVRELTEDKSKGWDERKRWQVEHVAHMSAPALVVKAADKLHNLATLVADLRASREPAQVWARFRGGREKTLALSAALVAALEPRVPAELARALRATLRELEALAR